MYDVIVIGSGLGGLVSALILAKEGKKVCVLEQSNQYGGNLQTFVRDKTIFDTGVHYIGGLEKGQNLHQYFDYLGIMNELKLSRMEARFDQFSYGTDDRTFGCYQDYQTYEQKLIADFPTEVAAIQRYLLDIQECCTLFPLYNVQVGTYTSHRFSEISIAAYLKQLTDNELLKSVLVGNNFLYAGSGLKTPFYVHALIINSYIQSAWHCINGGSQIAKALVNQLRSYGADLYKRTAVVHINMEDGLAKSVVTQSGSIVEGNIIISNIEPRRTLEMIGKEHFRKSYFDRIQQIPVTTGAFSIHLSLKKNSVLYLNANHYHFKDHQAVWVEDLEKNEGWPHFYMLSMTQDQENKDYAASVTILTYINYKAVIPWENTLNNKVNENIRSPEYEEFKATKMQALLDLVTIRFPQLQDAILNSYTATPLTYRDYLGIHEGAIYGIQKDINHQMYNTISPQTKIENLFFTGQNTNLHGILGVTVGAFITSGYLVGLENLVDKVIACSKKNP